MAKAKKSVRARAGRGVATPAKKSAAKPAATAARSAKAAGRTGKGAASSSAATRRPAGGVAQELEQLRRRVTGLEDIHAVRTLHFKYGYYIDMCLYDEAVDLFAEDGEVRFLNGVYKGKAGVR